MSGPMIFRVQCEEVEDWALPPEVTPCCRGWSWLLWWMRAGKLWRTLGQPCFLKRWLWALSSSFLPSFSFFFILFPNLSYFPIGVHCRGSISLQATPQKWLKFQTRLLLAALALSQPTYSCSYTCSTPWRQTPYPTHKMKHPWKGKEKVLEGQQRKGFWKEERGKFWPFHNGSLATSFSSFLGCSE